MTLPHPDPIAAAYAASLPLDVMADPDDLDESGLRVWTRSAEAISYRRLRDGARLVAGWGETAWRTTLNVVPETTDSDLGVPQDRSTAWSLMPPTEAVSTSLETRLREWHQHTRATLAEVIPNAIDAATRSELVERILAPPIDHARAQDRALRRLLAAHRTLRWAARRVVFSTVATLSLHRPLAPAQVPSWRFLAFIARIPYGRLTPELLAGHLAEHDAGPQCPTAKALSHSSPRHGPQFRHR